MKKFSLAALASAALTGAIIGLSAPAEADTTQASEDVHHSVAPLESMGSAATTHNHGHIDAFWFGRDSH